MTGIAHGAGKVSNITIQDQPFLVEIAAETISFSKTIHLHPGENRISIEAEDLKGQRTVEELFVVADWNPPQLTIQNVKNITHGWTADLICADDTGLDYLSYNGTRLPTNDNLQQTTFSLKIRKSSDALFAAMDLAGNKLEVDLRTMFPPSDDPTQEMLLRGIEQSEENPLIMIHDEKPGICRTRG